MTLRERWENIKVDWLGTPREVRYTAVGWEPPGYYPDVTCGDKSASGEVEYSRIIRHKPKWTEQEERNQNERKESI